MRLNKQSPFTLSCVKKRRFPSLSFFHHTCIGGSARTGVGVRRSLNLLRGRTFAYSISHQCCYLWHGAGPTTSLWPTFVRDNQQHPSLRRIHRTIRMISRHCITLGKAIYDLRAEARARALNVFKAGSYDHLAACCDKRRTTPEEISTSNSLISFFAQHTGSGTAFIFALDAGFVVP